MPALRVAACAYGAAIKPIRDGVVELGMESDSSEKEDKRQGTIYTQSENKYSRKIDFLLISIIDDPEAHRTAKMSTPQDKAVMQYFAEIAKEFIFSGKIIA
jgi:hypothetical protein